MSHLLLPELVTVRLVTSAHTALSRPDILIFVHLLARNKNDFHLGPYPTNAEGIARITKSDLQAEIEAAYDSGVMDYGPAAECYSLIQIVLATPEAIAAALESRTKGWTSLLRGEDRRWKSIDELRGLYRRAEKATLRLSFLSPARIQDEWTDSAGSYDYAFTVASVM